MEKYEDWEDENVIAFLDDMYNQLNSIDFQFTRKQFYKLFYDDLKSFKDGEW